GTAAVPGNRGNGKVETRGVCPAAAAPEESAGGPRSDLFEGDGAGAWGALWHGPGASRRSGEMAGRRAGDGLPRAPARAAEALGAAAPAVGGRRRRPPADGAVRPGHQHVLD